MTVFLPPLRISAELYQVLNVALLLLSILHILLCLSISIHTHPYPPHTTQHGMLVNRPSAFIFQQIILPYIASTSRATTTTTTHQQRYFSSSSSATKPFESQVQVEREGRSTWEPYPASVSGLKQRTREYLGIGDDRKSSGSSSKSKGKGVEVDPNGKEAYKRTAALAMERIIKSHQPVSSGSGVRVKTSYKEKWKAQIEGNGPSPLDGAGLGNAGLQDGPEVTSHQGTHSRTKGEISSTTSVQGTKTTSTSTTQISAEPAPTKRRPFPPIVHQLLQARQFRLAVNHILSISAYALDPVLVDNVAGFMERHGGGRAAERLRRGKIPTAEEKAAMTQNGEERLPDEYWSLICSSRPLPKTLDDVSTYMPGIDLTPTDKFTAFCNIQLAHLLSTDSARSVIPPKHVRKPNVSLRQLSDLLARIHHLENHRGFIPDRVTANIILSCWLRCSLAPSPSGLRLAYTKSGWKPSLKHNSKGQGAFGKKQLGALFDTISKLIDRSILSRDESLSYQRHVQPFVRMLNKGFFELEHEEGFVRVKEWDRAVKKVLLERQAGGAIHADEKEEKESRDK
jgi:hypothetical protein